MTLTDYWLPSPSHYSCFLGHTVDTDSSFACVRRSIFKKSVLRFDAGLHCPGPTFIQNSRPSFFGVRCLLLNHNLFCHQSSFRHNFSFFFQLDLSGSEPDDAVLEEKAALSIQKRMMEQLDDQDFGFDLLEVMFL